MSEDQEDPTPPSRSYSSGSKRSKRSATPTPPRIDERFTMAERREITEIMQKEVTSGTGNIHGEDPNVQERAMENAVRIVLARRKQKVPEETKQKPAAGPQSPRPVSSRRLFED